MKFDFTVRAAEILKREKEKKRRFLPVGIAAFGTAVLTIGALTLPAITMEKTPVCQLEEHEHSEACYEREVLGFSCSPETLGVHQHSEDCLNESGETVCGYAEDLIHVHGEQCFNKTGEQICPLPELKEHQHSEGCYEETQVLVCGQEEIRPEAQVNIVSSGDAEAEEQGGHIHTEACYETQKNLICNLEEILAHIHSEACYDETGMLVCGLLERKEHIHDEVCIQQGEAVLICGLEEHIHDQACYAVAEDAPTSAKHTIVWKSGKDAVISGNRIDITPSDWRESMAVYQIQFSCGGEYEVEAGEIEIRVPAHIFLKRDGTPADRATVPLSSEGTPSGKTGFWYRIDSMGTRDDKSDDEIVISNYKKISSAYFFECEIQYRYISYEVAGGFENNQISAFFRMPDEKGEIREYTSTDTLTAAHHTDAKLNRIQKSASQKYETWQSEWGEEPEDADDYFYMEWSLSIEADTHQTQPYHLIITDNGGLDGEAILIRHDSTVVMAENGVAKYVEDYPDTHYRSQFNPWYIVTRHSRELLKDGNKPEITNTVTVELDGYEEAYDKKESSWTWRYEPVNTDYPGYLYSFEKGSYGSVDEKINDLLDGEVVFLDDDFSLSATARKPQEQVGNNETIHMEINDGYPVSVQDGQFQMKISNGEQSFVLEEGDFSFVDARLDFQTYDMVLSPDLGWTAVPHEEVTDKVDIYLHITGNSKEWIKWAQVEVIDDDENRITFYQEDGQLSEEYVDFSSSREWPILFPKNTSGVRLCCDTLSDYVSFEFRPRMQLNPTEHAKKIVGSLLEEFSGPWLYFYNWGSFTVENSETSLYEKFSSAAIHMTQRSGTSSLYKNCYCQLDNVNNQVIMQYDIDVSEFTWATKKEHLNSFESGKLYDLLPKGTSVENIKVNTKDGTDSDSIHWETEFIEDWRGSGQTMMILSIQGPPQNITGKFKYPGYDISYNLINTFENIIDNGRNITNYAAWQTDIGTLWQGKDDSYGVTEDIIWKEYFHDLNGDGNVGLDNKTTLYDENTTYIDFPLAMESSFRKSVKVPGESYHDGSSVAAVDGTYSYRLRYQAPMEQGFRAKNIVFYDVLETAHKGAEHWQGLLKSVGLGNTKEKGCAPVVYYSVIEDIQPYDENGMTDEGDLSNTDLWSVTPPEDLREVTALAFDLRNTEAGEFVLENGQSLYVEIFMQATPEKEEDIPADGSVYAYNDAACSVRMSTDGDLWFGSTEASNIVSVSYYQPPISIPLQIHKVNEAGDSLEGVKFTLYPALVDEEGNWTIDEENKETAPITAVTDENGVLKFSEKRLPGNYLLYETEPLPGYQQPSEPWRLILHKDGSVQLQDYQGIQLNPEEDQSYRIMNRIAYELPATGGMGTLGYIVCGLLLTFIACVGIRYQYLKRRRCGF